MAVPAQYQIDRMVRFHLIQDVWGVRQQHREPAGRRHGHAAQVGPVQRGIVDAYDRQFPPLGRDERALIHEQRHFVTVGEFRIG